MWQQSLVCFAFWIIYGVLIRRRSNQLRKAISSYSRNKRIFLGSAGLVGSAIFMMAGLYIVVMMGGVAGECLTPLGWVSVGLLGLVFVHLQILGAAAMITLALESRAGSRQ